MASARKGDARGSAAWSYYFKLEGRGTDPESGDFGFFVHCLISSASIECARITVRNDLESDGYRIIDTPFEGRFVDFSWEDPDLESELRTCAQKAGASPHVPVYSDFHRWWITEVSDVESQ